MAFNPFHAFRKYKKSMFAVLAIVCMFTFVLSSGLGGKNDMLNMVPEMFGGTSSKNPEVAKIDGKRIDGRALEVARTRRRMANGFMELLLDSVGNQMKSQAQAQVKDFLITQQQKLPQIIEGKVRAARYHSGLAYDFDTIRMNMQFAGQLGLPLGLPLHPETVLKDDIDYLSRETLRLVRDKKKDEANYLAQIQALLEQDKTRMNAPLTVLYFGGSIDSGDDIVDFLAWKWEADRRKIQITPETLAKLIDDEMMGQDYSNLMEPILDFLKKNYRNFNQQELMEALTDEFRVRMVQGQLMGDTDGMSASPSVVTPYEFRKYFNEECKSIRTALLTVDVQQYVAKVTATPSDAELKELFEKNKKAEFNPAGQAPGFLTPKRVKLEFVGGKPDSPYFRKLGQDKSTQDALLAVVSMVTSSQGGGLNPSASLWTAGSASQLEDIPDVKIEREYKQYRANDRFRNWTYSALLFFNPNIHDTSVMRPEIMAATVADILASRASGAPIVTPVIKLNTMAIEAEMRTRIEFGLQTLAFVGADSKSLLGVNDGLIPQPLPLSVVRNKIAEELKIPEDLGRKAFVAEFNKFMEEMKKKAKDLKKPDAVAKKTAAKDPAKPDAKDDKKPDPQAEIAKLIDDFVKKHNLTRGGSKNLDDRFSLLNDEGLKDLKERYHKDPRVAADKLGVGAAAPYFADGNADRFGGQPLGLYDPTWFNGNTPQTAVDLNDPFYLTWKTEEVDPKVRTFADAKPDVIAAWKLIKARELAEADAKKLQEKFGENRNLAVLRDFAVENNTPLVELDPIAKFRPESNPFGNNAGFTYRPRAISPVQVEYPGFEMTEKLLELRDKKVGATVITHDQPKSKYYVGVLVEVIDVDEFEFQQAFTRTADGPVDQLLRLFDTKQRDDYRKAVLAELRKSAKVTTVPEELKKFAMRDSGRGGSPDSEE